MRNNELNLNLLRVLVQIAKHGNLKQAGLALGRTESVVSRHLSTLREQLNDPLFVRTRYGLEPTHFTIRFLEEAGNALEVIDRALIPDEFVSEEYQGDLDIAMSNIVLSHSGAKCYDAIRKNFPLSTINFFTWKNDTIDKICHDDKMIGIHLYQKDRPQLIYQNKIGAIDVKLVINRKFGAPNWDEAKTFPCIVLRSVGWNDQQYALLNELLKHYPAFKVHAFVDDFNIALQLLDNHKITMAIPSVCVTPKYHVIDFPSVVPSNLISEIPIVSCVKYTQRYNPIHQKLSKIISTTISQ
ncbi:LysR family transcriptional regulator [Vibrio sp. SCSIO 43136]|uniref:LysR family transcriptional regulator n=1 Tax=Vibrio sp. SCSIO 43136 TaxID=2819101 RepID=UPI002076634E|nr:LysR family transcriptional regulator [Vibrio sp. SCSIO 43136]USD67243.1 LysR family transcriptional regulator [Vibrio sp. SCSIO 43136]